MLEGHRAVDFCDEKGSACGRILADLGVEVIKVQDSRSAKQRFLELTEKGLFDLAYDVGKRSVTVDFSSAEGRRALRRLTLSADFVIESFEPGHLERLGLGYANLRKANPGAILTSITPFGQTGPRAEYKGSDLVVTAMSGLMFMCGDPDRAPLRLSYDHSYTEAGALAAAATLMADYHRRMTGRGQHIDVSMQACTMAGAFLLAPIWELNKKHLTRSGERVHRVNVRPQIVWNCKDGSVVFRIHTGGLGPRTKALVSWMQELGEAGDLGDVPWSTIDYNGLGQDQIDKWEKDFRAFFLKHTKKEIYEETQKRGGLLQPINTIGEAMEDIQYQPRGFWLSLDVPGLGKKILYPSLPFRSNLWRQTDLKAPPAPGADNDLLKSGPSEKGRASSGKTGAGKKLTTNASALAGLKVIDLAWNIAGPLATKYLGDYGATVVKVESASRPDTSRTSEGPTAAMGVNQSLYFSAYNSSKYSLGLNLTHPRAREVFKKLVAWADVLVESFTPGTLEKWGLGYEALRDVNPGLVMARVSLYGQTGPRSKAGGFGNFVQAACGLNGLAGWPDRIGGLINQAVSDNMTSWFVLTSIFSALEHRDKTGQGQCLDVPLQEVTMYMLAPLIAEHSAFGKERKCRGNRNPDAAPHGVFRCKGDDRWCALTIFTDDEWRRFGQAIASNWTKEGKFATLRTRKEREDELEKLVETWSIERTAEEAMVLLQGFGLACGVLQNGQDLLGDPQIRERHYFWELDHPEMGRMHHAGNAFNLMETPPVLRREPLLAEHTESVCRDIIGMSDAEFVDLYQSGVFE